VSNYLKMEGSAGWVGNLFVFDGRLSLPPGTFMPSSSAEAVVEGSSSSRWVGRCYSCGSEVVELRHRNCANIDCNRLYLYASTVQHCCFISFAPLVGMESGDGFIGEIMVQVLRVVCGGAGRLLLLGVQDRSSAAAAASRTPEIREMACIPRWVAGGRCQLRRRDVASDGGLDSCCWAYFSNGQIYIYIYIYIYI
jgi:hypothetical protein